MLGSPFTSSYYDQFSFRYPSGQAEKCTKCRSLLNEMVDERVVESAQFAVCSGQPGLKLMLQHAVNVALPSYLVGQLQVGDNFIVHGYANCSIDGGFLQYMNLEPRVYLFARSIEKAKMPYQPFAPAENLRPFDNIDGLISKLQCGEVMTSIWRQLSLLLIATFSSCFSERPLNLLIITDDTNIINKLVSRLPEHRALNEEAFAQKIFKIYSSKHIQGKNYTVSTGTTLEHEGCLYLENIEMLKPAELSSLAYNARKCGLIACCPFRGIKNVASISSEFDLVISVHELLHHDILASASFIWASCTQNDKLALDPYFSKGPLPISCETLLKKYFLASRSVIGKSNDMALFPLYDPSRQQSFGIQLARAFQAIRCDEGMAREDVLLSLVVQEINLMHRLGSTVFQDKREEGVGQVMPSPSPSVDARVPNGPSHTGPSTFASRYGQVIRAIQIQLNLS